MPDQEKRAWIALTIILIALIAYFSLISFVKFDSASMAVFAIVGFLGFRRFRGKSREAVFDERDRQIERNALLTSLRVFYVFLILFSVVVGFTQGWHTSVPIWMAVQIFWAVSLVMWALKALLIIVQYRRGAYA
jgi:uncharacterized membrane protein (DUF485 family)